MTRELTGHRINPANDTLAITVVDEPGSGGANHVYFITGHAFDSNPGAAAALEHAKAVDKEGSVVLFQNGPINEVGVNGVTHEALMEILIDRLKGFQSGQYACRENAVALTHLETAKLWLAKRTLDRMARGVEGTHTV